MRFRLFFGFLVGFASAFNTFAIQAGGRPLSVGLIASGLYFISIIPAYNSSKFNSTIKESGRFVFLPLFFCLLLAIMNLIYYRGGGIFPFSIFMDWLLMYAMLYHSKFDNRAIEFCLYGFAVGATILSILFYLGIGVEINTIQEGERFSMFGSNENVLGIIQALSSAIILNLFIINDRLKIHFLRFLFVIPLLLSAAMIFATGSRTALLILVSEFVFTILLYQTKKRYKIIIIIASMVVVFFLIQWFLSSDYAIVTRVFSVIEEGNTGGRTDIWGRYLTIFPEHPIFGVGEEGMLDIAIRSGVGTTDILGYPTALSPHNVLLEVLMKTGIVGLLIMGVFWLKIFRCTVKSRKYYGESLPLILFIPILVVLFSGQILTEKYAWFIYAYMIAASNGRLIVNNVIKQ